MKRVLFIALALLLVAAATAQAQTPPQTQAQTETQTRLRATAGPFVDANGDGICDNLQRSNRVRVESRGRFGPADGTGTKGIGPRDGTGYAPGGQAGSGVCDGTGPKGAGARAGRHGGGGRR